MSGTLVHVESDLAKRFEFRTLRLKSLDRLIRTSGTAGFACITRAGHVAIGSRSLGASIADRVSTV